MLTRNEFLEWKSQSVTQEVFNYLKEYRQGWEQKTPLRETAEKTFKEAAIREGVLLGIDALFEMDVYDE